MSEREELTSLGERLYELLHHFEPSGADYFGKDDLETVVEELLAEAAAQRWVKEQMAQMGIRAMAYRHGEAVMELEPARDMVAIWCASAKALLMNAENYSETTFVERPEDLSKASYSMDVGLAGLPERYTLTVQRVAPGKLTPHEARSRAEGVIGGVWQWIADRNDGLGCDTGDLASILERGGYSPPADED